MKKQLKGKFAIGVIALYSLSFTACDSSTSSHSASEHEATEEHAGHEEMETMATNAPDYTSVSEEVKSQIAETYKSYLTLKNALVEAKSVDAKKAAQSLKANAEKVASAPVEGEAKNFISEQVAMVNQHADQIAGSTDIEAQRSQLNMISSSLFSLIKATGANTEKTYYQYCPMANNEKGAYWLSESQEIRNPYFGDKMLTCGENKETLSAQ